MISGQLLHNTLVIKDTTLLNKDRGRYGVCPFLIQASPTAAVPFFVSQPRLCNASPDIRSDVSFLFLHIKHTVPGPASLFMSATLVSGFLFENSFDSKQHLDSLENKLIIAAVLSKTYSNDLSDWVTSRDKKLCTTNSLCWTGVM